MAFGQDETLDRDVAARKQQPDFTLLQKVDPLDVPAVLRWVLLAIGLGEI